MSAPAALAALRGRRVVHVCLDPGVPVFGRKGCSVHVQEVLRVLVAAGAHVDVVAARLGGPLPAGLEGVRVHHLPPRRGADPADRERALVELDTVAAQRVRELVEAGAALVYERYALFSCSALEIARAAGVPTTLEVNAPLPQEAARHRGLVAVDEAVRRTRRVLRAATRAVAVSSPVARWATGLAGVPAVVVPNGVDVERFRPSTAPRPARPFTVAFVGGFRPWHGVDLLVEAAARACASGAGPLRLLLVGDGPGRPAVLERAAALGLDVDAPGALDPAQVPAALAAADAAVAPYRAGEAYFSPLKVAEYLAAGLPTVVADVGDLATTYADGDELLVVPPDDVPALAAALRRLALDPVLAQRLSRAGRQAVRDRRTWAHAVERSLPDLREAARLPGPGRAA